MEIYMKELTYGVIYNEFIYQSYSLRKEVWKITGINNNKEITIEILTVFAEIIKFYKMAQNYFSNAVTLINYFRELYQIRVKDTISIDHNIGREKLNSLNTFKGNVMTQLIIVEAVCQNSFVRKETSNTLISIQTVFDHFEECFDTWFSLIFGK